MIATGPMDRIAELRQQVMVRKGSFVDGADPCERDRALAAAVLGKDVSAERTGILADLGGSPNGSVVQTRARFLLELAKSATIKFYPQWRLAGEHLPHGFGSGDPKNRETLDPKIVEAVQAWEGRRRWAQACSGPSDAYRAGTNPNDWLGAPVILAIGWIENHSIRDYAKVLRIGFGGIRREIEAAMAATPVDHPDFVQRENFWLAAMAVCDAGIVLGRRYAALARAEGRLEAAAACERVPAEGARTLFEATQALWLAHILTCGEDGINANSLGRLDQILYPYYKADVDAGRITRDDAEELMAELACKLYLDYDVQAITLGGVDRHGNDAVNELSMIMLDATARVDFIRDLSVRVNRNTPKAFIDRCAELVVHGGGIPFFFNEESFIPALHERGIAIEDARDFAPIGCVELTIPGRANPHAVSGWINSTKCLELALHGGWDIVGGVQMGPKTKTLAEMTTYEELVEAYREQLAYFTRNMVYVINCGELQQREHGPLPCWSVLTDDCISRGRDITDGGAVYNYHSICFIGTANTADSLMAVKKLVFEEKRVNAAELLAALKVNFEGYEVLRQELLEKAPKYGNDCGEVDQLASWVANDFIDRMDNTRSALGGRFFVHLFSFYLNVYFGRKLGATPDGRKAGEPVAYSLSAQQGRDEEGVTAMLNTLVQLPHHRAAGGSAAIIDMDPKLVEGPNGPSRLSQIVRAAIRMGVGQMQFNVVTEERLRQAQKDPEKYGNIPVRVAGYSQMFRLLPAELQEHVIARTKHVDG